MSSLFRTVERDLEKYALQTPASSRASSSIPSSSSSPASATPSLSSPAPSSSPASATPASATPASATPSSSTPSSSSTPASATPAPSYILSEASVAGIENAGSAIYTGASDIGIFFALVKMVIHILISIFLLFIGTAIITTPNSVSLTCKIISINNLTSNSTCNKTESGQYNCQLGIEYTIQGKTYNKNIQYVGNTQYNIGNDIIVYYKDGSDITDPSNFMFNKEPDISRWTKLFGWFLVLVAIVYSSYSIMNFIAAKNYKVVGAAQGVGTVNDFMNYGTKSILM